MARIRSLKPGFFTNEHLCELPFEDRLLFAGLWLLADREGRLEDRPRRIKAFVFPYDVLEVDRMLTALAEKDLVVRYAADGVAYLWIPTFLKHQRPKHDEAPSVIPAYVSGMESTLLEKPRGNVVPPRPYKGVLDLGSGQRTEDSAAGAACAADGVDESGEAADGAGAQRRAEDFAALWNDLTMLPIPRCREVSTKRRRQIKTRLTERPWEEWDAVFRRVQASTFCRGQTPRGTWVATFDWVIGSPDVAVKVLEGKYDDRDVAFTEMEIAAARLHRQKVTCGRCPHREDPCEFDEDCLEKIARGMRERKRA